MGELAGRLPVGRPAVSKHLRVLEGAGLVEWHTGVWDTALGSFAQFVDDSTDDRERNRP